MSFINPQAKEINCKIVYCGPQNSGKSTSLHQVYEQTSSAHRGKLVSLSNNEDQTLFFDFLPLSLGKVKGHTIRFHLYTVPGDAHYDSAQKMILKGIDGVIFVIDSRIDRLEDNLKSWKSLEANLKTLDNNLQSLPIVFQYNKRDDASAIPVEELRQFFNKRNLPEFETVAKQGKNVMECFQAIAKQVLVELKKT